MKINHVQHLAVNTKNIEESVAFYRDILGFTETSRADMGDSILVYMHVCGDTYMELFDLKGNVVDEDAAENRRGLRHIAFDVDNLYEWNDFLKEKNIPFILDVVEMPIIGKRAILVLDPNGTVVELCENL